MSATLLRNWRLAPNVVTLSDNDGGLRLIHLERQVSALDRESAALLAVILGQGECAGIQWLTTHQNCDSLDAEADVRSFASPGHRGASHCGG